MSDLKPMQNTAFNNVIDATATTGSIALDVNSSNGTTIAITNLSADNAVFCVIGDSTVTAVYPTTSAGQRGMFIPKGASLTFTNQTKGTHLAAICDTALTATAVITMGGGE